MRRLTRSEMRRSAGDDSRLILYELAKRFEERSQIHELLRRTHGEAGQMQALREEKASLERRLYEQARQWLNSVQLSALLPAAVPSDLAMLPGVSSLFESAARDMTTPFMPDAQTVPELADEEEWDEDLRRMAFAGDSGLASPADIVL